MWFFRLPEAGFWGSGVELFADSRSTRRELIGYVVYIIFYIQAIIVLSRFFCAAVLQGHDKGLC